MSTQMPPFRPRAQPGPSAAPSAAPPTDPPDGPPGHAGSPGPVGEPAQAPRSAPPAPAFALGGPPSRSRLVHGPLPRVLWFALVGLAVVVLVAARASGDLADRLVDAHLVASAAVVVTAGYAAGVAHRVGGRPFVSLSVGLVLAVAGVATGSPEVTAGAALATAVLAGLLAVLVTVPAVGVLAVVREVVVALVVAVVGALAVAAYAAAADPMRFGYVALAASVAGALALVSQLGSRLHGLSRRGVLVLAVGVVVLVVAVVYSEALSRWGATGLVDTVGSTRTDLDRWLGAVPHPIQALIGWPALVWGVSMRARRRQAWWVCVFGVAATVPVACALIDPAVGLEHAALGILYSVVVGVLIGAVLVRVDLAWTGPRGRRSARSSGPALRPEPGRTRALR